MGEVQGSIYKRMYLVHHINRRREEEGAMGVGPFTVEHMGLMTVDEVLVALIDYELNEAPWGFRSYKVQWNATTSFEGRVAVANDMVRGDNEGTPWAEYCKKTEEQS